MNIKRINNDLLGRLYKGKNVYYSDLTIISEDNTCNYYLLSDSYFVAILDINNTFINLEKCKYIKNMYENLIPDDSKYLYTHVTDTIMLSGKDNLRVLENENNKILVNDKYLELFKDCTFKSLNDTKPIICYEKGEVVGIILPVKQF